MSEVDLYSFSWSHGAILAPEIFHEMAKLYSTHYGVWGDESDKSGEPIRLSANRIRKYACNEDIFVAQANLQDEQEIVGYAIVLEQHVPYKGTVAWITQFVVHTDHRKKGVGRNLLYAGWQMSDYYAWGLLTCNPYAVRALESATMRRCDPSKIAKSFPRVLNACAPKVTYIGGDTTLLLSKDNAQADTKFFIDHSNVPAMIKDVSSVDKTWQLGDLHSGYEWVAFTFREQPQISMSPDRLNSMLRAADEVTKQAYSRMGLADNAQGWARHTNSECDFIQRELNLSAEQSLLDFGCGSGRHVLEFRKRGIDATGVDYVDHQGSITQIANIKKGDCRTIDLQRVFDHVICLYDVVGSYANDDENLKILKNIKKHLKPGGKMLLSVMNMDVVLGKGAIELTVELTAQDLNQLPPSNTMERSGDVFKPPYLLIDRNKSLVYRKEQFRKGQKLPQELIVRDRRYQLDEIQRICREEGFNVLWAKRVRAGRWINSDDPIGKEILLLCELPT